MEALVLVDANNWLHRFHHGMPPQIHHGRNVAAVRGLRDLAGRLARQLAPAAILAVFDGGDGGRTALFPSYKSGRAETPPELAYQIDLAREHLPRLGTATTRVDGFEADDVIAALAGPARAAGRAVHIVSGDKDLCALVADRHPAVVIHAKRGEEWQVFREADVQARLGVAPPFVLDLLALAGDGSDGIPGVPGIGPKTAAELLRAHGALEPVLRAAPSMGNERRRMALVEHAEAVRLYRRVLDFAPVPFDTLQASTWSATRRS
ncbi:5'-3' exonuclease [Nannocystis pusilla]|uniref:5'-3' exonuclease n=1 Tax=Nannocystis pusilla TaxID=889268 RepID=UPI003B815CF1